ncbi:PREDICTED: tRNA-dihydrouridine(20a/20b) synthase [NAD(P)+]-like [Acropora digitifera]|uniref:tRNA-dihydrouridine(20a/20b) synthase [NAD(P)+]-like n=1 Tax=Acropora digitifera TaxID=70779 RepID=UPI00077A7B15|nr:PREDICTED: tRNA-dihydrouridine(20a/20b) synthase [NAD(P)+]-like [Acropora digitifera]
MADPNEESHRECFIYEKPLQLFEEKKVVRMCAPMVRYSKLPFRTLVRRYGCDLVFTPMIVADCFVKSVKARDMEFTTNAGSVIIDLNKKYLAIAVTAVVTLIFYFISMYRWALQEGYGAKLINNPEIIKDIVRKTTCRIPGLPVSIKIRIHENLRKTVELCKQAENAGVAWITVHGRTVKQRGEPADLEAIKLIKQSVSVPVVANGDIKSEADVRTVYEKTGVNGNYFVLVKEKTVELCKQAENAGVAWITVHGRTVKQRGEPADLEAIKLIKQSVSVPVVANGDIKSEADVRTVYEKTGVNVFVIIIQVNIALSHGTSFTNFHHHLMFMLEKVTSKAERRVFSELKSTPAVLNYLNEHYGI